MKSESNSEQQGLSSATRRILFFLFFVSGFCGLVYQVVWTRMAFASFGIIAPVLSVVISVFMLGLCLGSWAAGSWVAALKEKFGASAIIFYGFVELMIAVGAFAVPKLFAFGERLLLTSGQTDSVRYLSLSATSYFSRFCPGVFYGGQRFPDDGVHSRTRPAKLPVFQFSLPCQRARGDERRSSHGAGPGRTLRISRNFMGRGDR